MRLVQSLEKALVQLRESGAFIHWYKDIHQEVHYDLKRTNRRDYFATAPINENLRFYSRQGDPLAGS